MEWDSRENVIVVIIISMKAWLLVWFIEHIHSITIYAVFSYILGLIAILSVGSIIYNKLQDRAYSSRKVRRQRWIQFKRLCYRQQWRVEEN